MQSEQIYKSVKAATDPAVQQKYREDPVAALEEMRSHGVAPLELLEGQEVKVVFNTADTFYLPLPAIDENAEIDEQALSRLQAAGEATVSSAGSVGTAGTIGTGTSTTSTVSTVASIGSVGSTD